MVAAIELVYLFFLSALCMHPNIRKRGLFSSFSELLYYGYLMNSVRLFSTSASILLAFVGLAVFSYCLISSTNSWISFPKLFLSCLTISPSKDIFCSPLRFLCVMQGERSEMRELLALLKVPFLFSSIFSIYKKIPIWKFDHNTWVLIFDKLVQITDNPSLLKRPNFYYPIFSNIKRAMIQ